MLIFRAILIFSLLFLQVQPSDRLMLSHGQALHKRTTMAVLIKVHIGGINAIEPLIMDTLNNGHNRKKTFL